MVKIQAQIPALSTSNIALSCMVKSNDAHKLSNEQLELETNVTDVFLSLPGF